MRETREIEVKVGFDTTRGRVRKMNEDSLCVFVPYPGSQQDSEFQAILGVADGMGGHKAGDLASRIITQRLNAAFIRGGYEQEFAGLNDFSLVLKNVIREINRKVYSLSKRNKNLGEIGSTLTFGIIKNAVLYLVHIGDSRCYCIRNGHLDQLTKDHSWVAEQVSSGVLSEKEALNHPKNNVITQAVGFDPNIEPQMLRREVKAGDRYVFCSDGLTRHVSDEEILEIVNKNSHPQRACEALIDLANQRGGQDNITAVIGYVNPDLLATREDEIREWRQQGKKKYSTISKILLGILILVISMGVFLLGSWHQKYRMTKKINRLLVQIEEDFNQGNHQKAFLAARSLLEIDKNNKTAQKLLKKYNKEVKNE